MTADAGAPARELVAWKQHVVAAWPTVGISLVDDGSSSDRGAAREVVAELDAGELRRDEIVVQLLHGPVLADGTFDETLLSVLPMVAGADGRYRAEFAPDRAGRWGTAARAMPTHPHLSGPFDTGLVTIG
jgi:starch phosphorylase